jgi:hypothetical protein
MTKARPLAGIRTWHAKDGHTGIGALGGVPYTYRQLDGRTPPSPPAEVYRVETFIEAKALIAIQGKVHYVPGPKLQAFFEGWDRQRETVTDIRPLTYSEAVAEISAFRASAEKGSE